MDTSSISNHYNNVSSLLSNALQGTGISANSSGSSVSGISGQASDSSQLSPFAQLLSTLQQLEQSNPAEYKQITQKIATNLQTAAQTATSNGNTSAASQLTQLSTDFTNASTSGQLPNIQDLAQAVSGGGGEHHHHHHSDGGSSSSTADTSNTSSTPGSTSSTSTSTAGSTTASSLEQLLAAFQSGSSQNNALNPLSIIMNTLSSAGLTPTTSA